MPKVKLTKTALKQERDSLKQFQRFLPTLQLKKQQLQMEMRTCLDRIERNRELERETKQALASWTALFGDPESVEKIRKNLSVREVITGEQNIAGVDVPVFQEVVFDYRPFDLYAEDPWLDDAAESVKKIVSIQEEREVIRRQYELIADELRVTTQRVNLFEKVKIPECKENIRAIQIYLGDMDTAAVARSKIAKKKLQAAGRRRACPSVRGPPGAFQRTPGG